ncbi:CRTAC1 family protein [Paraglaciecola sp. 20A4]|uniref:CRTAC1 family protein n=1 Tax=Paraglaciecola sp. 20A4 TaxID=2687288 RepID=UPI00140B93B3|nr:CRTAC1 family protein [Paraglaciecola sp. 20A4]
MKTLFPTYPVAALSVLIGLTAGCQSAALSPLGQVAYGEQSSEKASSVQTRFSAAKNVIALENKSRRKWDNPVIADLDQDGYDDLLLTDHGYSVKLYWNNKGTFGKGYDLIMGDMHGIGVGDFDKDGVIDALISRGGGSGANARNAKLFHFSKDRKISKGEDFSPALRNMRGRTSKFFDADNDGDLDLALLGFPSKDAGPEGENYLYRNDGKGNLTQEGLLPRTHRDGQKMLITDFNQDNISDIILYGDGAVKALQGDAKFGFKDVTRQVLGQEISDVTGIAQIDFDNDGDFDLYLTRGKRLKAGDTFYDPQTSTLAFYTKRGPFQLDDLLLGEVLEIENLQTSYPDQDVFIGESGYQYQFPGEFHGGQNIRLVSSLALGWPDKPTKKGIYIGYIGNDTWRIAGTTNPPTTGVIKNVKSYVATKLPKGPSDILLENQHGHFIDVTEKAGLLKNVHNTGVAVGDFDNNGFADLFVVTRGNMVTPNAQSVLLNQGDGTFKLDPHHGVVSQELGATGSGADAIDFDLDGNLDLVYANERGRWHLERNSGFSSNDSKAAEAGHYLKVAVEESPRSKASRRDALVSVSACGNTQIQRVGDSGAPYTQSLRATLHFGLGSCTEIDKVIVRWSNGESDSAQSVSYDAILKLPLNKK